MAGSPYYGGRRGGYGRERTTTFSLTCEPKRELNAEDFERLSGTNTGAAMLRNRLFVRWPSTPDAYPSHDTIAEITRFIRETAQTSTSDLYYIQRDDAGAHVYLLRATDAVGLRMALHGRTFDQTDRERMNSYDDYDYNRGDHFSGGYYR